MLGNLPQFSQTKVPIPPIRSNKQLQQPIPPFLRLILTDPVDQRYPQPHMSPVSLPSAPIKVHQGQQIPEFSSTNALAMLSEVAILAEYTQKTVIQRTASRLASMSPKKYGYSPYRLPQPSSASPCNYSATEYPQNQSQIRLLRSPSLTSSNGESAEFSDAPATPDLMLQGSTSPLWFELKLKGWIAISNTRVIYSAISVDNEHNSSQNQSNYPNSDAFIIYSYYLRPHDSIRVAKKIDADQCHTSRTTSSPQPSPAPSSLLSSKSALFRFRTCTCFPICYTSKIWTQSFDVLVKNLVEARLRVFNALVASSGIAVDTCAKTHLLVHTHASRDVQCSAMGHRLISALADVFGPPKDVVLHE
ncbi:hypothetical protein HK100_000931 [Physocladia obscura]|uniref:Uncharacterized protein n=1 Tax=Physocladia obscura TaxID=109957 RepID=A0AAD5SXY4_9FUNG|nr:hypothetical protein HK100_000931 [Physocladia obscura]